MRPDSAPFDEGKPISGEYVKHPTLHRGLTALILGGTLGLLLQACMLVDGDRPITTPGVQGHVGLDISLQKNRTALLKPAAADTIFSLDTLIIVLSAADADTVTYRAPVTGRADTGAIALPPVFFELPALRNWMARIYTIDITENPVRRDTVHIDSVVFGVHPSDTVYVSKTVASAYSILRARFLSSVADSVADKVLYLRLRVDGITRDSVILGGRNATLRWLQTLSGGTIFAAGDSGRILKSTNDAQTTDSGAWTETVVTTQRLVGGHFPDATNGYIVSTGGQVFATANGGTSWVQRTSTSDSLNAAFFTGSAEGWAVGRGGGIYKTVNNANSWYATMISNTTQNLNGVHFPTPTIGFVVGENETILRTTNGNGSDALPDFGGVVWSPVAGGWFPQTSNTTTNIADIKFAAPLWGWVVGAGYVRRTVNGGATWLEPSGLNVSNPNAIWFSDTTHAYAVGADGAVSQYQSEWYWAPRTSGTSEDLHDVRFVGIDTGYMVGDNGTLRRTINGSTTSWPYVTWDAQTLPATNDEGDSAWVGISSGTSNALNAVHFGSSTTGWAVGVGGTIRKTTDSGASWSSQTSGTTNTLNAVHAISATTVYAVGVGTNGGANANMRRTTNGTSWSSLTSSVSTELRGITSNGSNRFFAVGASGVILRSTNGTSWSSQTSGTTNTLNAVYTNGSRVWAVGNGGVIRRRTNMNSGSYSTVTSGTTTDLNGVYFTSSNVGFVVGDGGLIRKCTNSNNDNWATKTSGTTENLMKVHFTGTDTGFVVGEEGTILKSTDAGETWTVLESGSSQDLLGLHVLTSSKAVAVGAGGTIRRTTTGGTGLQAEANTNALRSVFPVTSTLAYVAGAGGTIGKTTNAGTDWTLQTSGTANDLNGISFANANIGWAVGNSGTILKTTNGGVNWVAQTSGTSEHLRSVQAMNADTAYATGTSGIILKTVDGGAVWYEQESPVTEQMNRVFFLNSATGFAVGNNGKIVNAVNQGDNWTGGGIKRSLKGVYFTSVSTGWIVGDDGVILKTTDTGSTWIEQNREEGIQLYGVHFVDANTGWVSGENGYVLKTTNGGATWVPQNSGTSIDLRWVNFRDANRGFIIGGTESILETGNGGSDWTGLFVGVPGDREFDRLLTYKYLRPGQSQQVVLEAMDRFSLPLRGYQSVLNLTVGAGQDTTVNAAMSRCGHVDSLPCAP